MLLASTSLAAALAGAIAMAAATLSNVALAQNIRGSATGPTSAPGYDHADQYLHVQDIKPAENMYPVVQHPEQDMAAQAKLAALAAKTGKKPNIVVFLMDDVGWWDPGFNGGGVALGNATPIMDQLANEGLILTSAYSTPSCSPSRATIMTGQNPLHHGILRPPMYDEPGGLEDETTVAKLRCGGLLYERADQVSAAVQDRFPF
jgi:arylsulfatase